MTHGWSKTMVASPRSATPAATRRAETSLTGLGNEKSLNAGVEAPIALGFVVVAMWSSDAHCACQEERVREVSDSRRGVGWDSTPARRWDQSGLRATRTASSGCHA